MRSLGDRVSGLSRREKAELLNRLIQIEIQTADGELEPLAGQIAGYIVGGEHEYLGDLFEHFRLPFPLQEGVSEQEEARCADFIELYLGVRERLGVERDSLSNWLTHFLLMLWVEEASEKDHQACFDRWCLRYGDGFPKARGVQERLAELRGGG